MCELWLLQENHTSVTKVGSAPASVRHGCKCGYTSHVYVRAVCVCIHNILITLQAKSQLPQQGEEEELEIKTYVGTIASCSF